MNGRKHWCDGDSREKPGTRKSLCPSANATNTNSTLMGLGINPRLHSETPATNRLTHCTASDV